MKYSRPAFAILACALLPSLLVAQTETFELTIPAAAASSVSQTPEPAPADPASQLHAPAKQLRAPYFYASAHKRPLTPQDIVIREAVQSLGIDKHRFVLCELKDGSSLVGGIAIIERDYFRISQGIMDGRELHYSELKQAPQPVPAVAEHFTNGMKWTGFVAFCVAVSPVVLALLPFLFAGVLPD
jgi:hypothetical protein